MTAEFVVSVVCGTVLAVVVLVLRYLRETRKAAGAAVDAQKALDDMRQRIGKLEMERLGGRR